MKNDDKHQDAGGRVRNPKWKRERKRAKVFTWPYLCGTLYIVPFVLCKSVFCSLFIPLVILELAIDGCVDSIQTELGAFSIVH